MLLYFKILVLFPQKLSIGQRKEKAGWENEPKPQGLIPSNWVEIPILHRSEARPAFAPKGVTQNSSLVLVMIKRLAHFNNRNEESTALFV